MRRWFLSDEKYNELTLQLMQADDLDKVKNVLHSFLSEMRWTELADLENHDNEGEI
jgi:hypothetical protein